MRGTVPVLGALALPITGASVMQVKGADRVPATLEAMEVTVHTPLQGLEVTLVEPYTQTASRKPATFTITGTGLKDVAHVIVDDSFAAHELRVNATGTQLSFQVLLPTWGSHSVTLWAQTGRKGLHRLQQGRRLADNSVRPHRLRADGTERLVTVTNAFVTTPPK
jgi:hypothetical protein